MRNRRRDYLEDTLNVLPKNMGFYLDVMKKYPDEWWESSDSKVICRFQLNEPILLVPMIQLQNALEDILGAKELAALGTIS